MNAAIQKMKQTPGVYLVGLKGSTETACKVEVDEHGVTYLLSPLGTRDGVLSDEGWHADSYVIGKEWAKP